MTTVAVLPTWVRFAKNGAAGLRSEKYSRVSCPGRVQRGEANGTRAGTQRNMVCRLRSVVSPLGPGSRCARPGHECAKSRRAKRTVGHIPNSRCQTAQCCSFPRRVAAPGFVRLFAGAFTLRPPASPRGFGASGRRDSSDSVPPMRGDGAPTGALFLSVAPATRDHPVPGRPGPLSALHRGGFRMRTHEAGSR